MTSQMFAVKIALNSFLSFETTYKRDELSFYLLFIVVQTESEKGIQTAKKYCYREWD